MNSAYKPFPDVTAWPSGKIDYSEVDRFEQISNRLAVATSPFSMASRRPG
jgi:hypothetical protein